MKRDRLGEVEHNMKREERAMDRQNDSLILLKFPRAS